ncbi:hypothetical protein AB0469_30315 [Streptomyces sp. NPDC093801]|uniref:hypothetical protein n=1 Tax=Streptomyces sp. NPDC093801 TaxID=3155203 RepID=UPI000AA53BDF
MRETVGFGMFVLGSVGILVGGRGERGWDRWNRNQRIVCSVSGVLALAGLFVIG